MAGFRKPFEAVETSVQHYMPGLLNAIIEKKIDTTFLISHHLPLEQAPEG